MADATSGTRYIFKDLCQGWRKYYDMDYSVSKFTKLLYVQLNEG
jgi:hypothetical protein